MTGFEASPAPRRRLSDKIKCPPCGLPIGFEPGDCDPMQMELDWGPPEPAKEGC